MPPARLRASGAGSTAPAPHRARCHRPPHQVSQGSARQRLLFGLAPCRAAPPSRTTMSGVGVRDESLAALACATPGSPRGPAGRAAAPAARRTPRGRTGSAAARRRGCARVGFPLQPFRGCVACRFEAPARGDAVTARLSWRLRTRVRGVGGCWGPVGRRGGETAARAGAAPTAGAACTERAAGPGARLCAGGTDGPTPVSVGFRGGRLTRRCRTRRAVVVPAELT